MDGWLTRGTLLRLSALTSVLALAGMAQAQSLPTGGQIVSGSGTIAQSGNNMTITQGSDRMAADWQSFAITDGRLVTGQNPASSTLAAQHLLKLLA